MKKVFLFIVFLLFIYIVIAPVAAASNYKDDFDYILLDEERQEEIWKQFNLQKIEIDELYGQQAQPIVCFDVSSQGKVLLALKNSTILVFDDTNEVVCAYSFFNNGSFYAIFQEENICVFDVRSEMVIQFTLNGKFIQAQKAPMNSVNNNNNWNQFSDKFQQKKEISIDNKTYKLLNDNPLFDLLSTDFSKCVVVNGEITQVLYDVSSVRAVKTTLCCFLLIGFVLTCLIIILYKVKQTKI